MVKVSKENLDFNTLLSVNTYKDAITLFFGGYFGRKVRRFQLYSLWLIGFNFFIDKPSILNHKSYITNLKSI